LERQLKEHKYILMRWALHIKWDRKLYYTDLLYVPCEA
jgi:hypothetical protein